MNTIISDNLKELWEESIKSVLHNGNETDVCTDPNSVASFFGERERYTRELMGITLILKQPRNRIVTSTDLNINYSYLLANFLFLFKKDNTVDFIEFYNKKGRMFCDDGKTLNAPLGYRILNGKSQVIQLKKYQESD